jgi:hypothetical protein
VKKALGIPSGWFLVDVKQLLHGSGRVHASLAGPMCLSS